VDGLIARIERELLPGLDLAQVADGEAVEARRYPAGWELVGCGHFAAVFAHPEHPERVVKVYAPGRPGLEAEGRVYAKLGEHPAFSTCLHLGPGYLVLRRLHGTTMFDCFTAGKAVPAGAIADIDRALDYARSRGLFPHDVHARNVMVTDDGRGLVVDVSDFGHAEPCRKWTDVRWAWRWLYRPLVSWNRLPIPAWVLDGIRRVYRRITRWGAR
jgi:hypothetical protein